MLTFMAKRANRSGESHAVTPQALVAVVDDDESVRESLPDLLKELGFAAKAYASAHEFLAAGDVAETRCLLLDIAMPGMSGPELQQELTLRGQAIPIIFITARADESVRERLLAQGAVECLFKPFSEQQLRAALDAALRPI
jgi:FixJ family two-component response regulator